MQKIKNILIPTDFSENANQAAELAISTFIDADVRFYLVHVYYLHYSGAVMTGDLEELIEKDRRELLDAQKAALLAKFPEAQISSDNIQGRLVDTVMRLIKHNEIDLVAMGTKGASGLQASLLGSNAANLVRALDIPVLLVPKDSGVESIKKALFATDLKALNGFDTIEPLYNMVKSLGLKLHILNLTDGEGDPIEQDREELKLDSVFMGTDHSFHFRELKNAEDDIVDAAHEFEADMIVAVARHYGMIYRILHRSITRKLSMRSDLPLLILSEKK